MLGAQVWSLIGEQDPTCLNEDRNIPSAAAETQCSQISELNKYLLKKEGGEERSQDDGPEGYSSQKERAAQRPQGGGFSVALGNTHEKEGAQSGIRL